MSKRASRVVGVVGAALLSWTLVGCGTHVGGSAGQAGGAATNDANLVTLKMPGMSCPACAASIRGELTKIEGVTDIQTDPETKICKFRLTDKTVDIKAKLAEISKENDHVAGWEMVGGG